MTSGRCGRWACAALLAGSALLVGTTKATAASVARPVPAKPVFAQAMPPKAAVEPRKTDAVQPVQPSPAAAPVGRTDTGPGAGPGPASAVANPDDLPCLPVVCGSFSLGSSAIQAIADDVFEAFDTFIAHGVADVLDQVGSAIADTATAKIHLDAAWFEGNLAAMRSLAILVLLPMMLVGLMSAVIRRDASQLWRAGGVYVPVAILGGVVLIALTQKALDLTDWATSYMTGGVATGSNATMTNLKSAALKLAVDTGVASALAPVVLLIVLLGALLIWIELLLRTAAIYLVVLLLPLAMSGLVWKGTMQWTRKMLETLVALILSKFVIVVVLSLAAGMITGSGGVDVMMEGATLLLLAAFAPFAILRLVPIVEAGAISHLEGLERRPLAAAKRTAATAVQFAMMTSGGAGGGAALGDNGGDAGAALNANREPGGQLATPPSSAGAGQASPPSGGTEESPSSQPSGGPASTGAPPSRDQASPNVDDDD